MKDQVFQDTFAIRKKSRQALRDSVDRQLGWSDLFRGQSWATQDATRLRSVLSPEGWAAEIQGALADGQPTIAAKIALMHAVPIGDRYYLPLQASRAAQDGEAFGPAVLLDLGRSRTDAEKSVELFGSLGNRLLPIPVFQRFVPVSPAVVNAEDPAVWLRVQPTGHSGSNPWEISAFEETPVGIALKAPVKKP